jgi:hypothetical protein
MKLIGNPTRSTIFAESVSYTPGKTIDPTSSRMR